MIHWKHLKLFLASNTLLTTPNPANAILQEPSHKIIAVDVSDNALGDEGGEIAGGSVLFPDQY